MSTLLLRTRTRCARDCDLTEVARKWPGDLRQTLRTPLEEKSLAHCKISVTVEESGRFLRISVGTDDGDTPTLHSARPTQWMSPVESCALSTPSRRTGV